VPESAGISCLTRWDTVPFCRHMGTIYNVFLTGVSTPYLWTKLLLEALRQLALEDSYVR
jgi:hypothetical protein